VRCKGEQTGIEMTMTLETLPKALLEMAERFPHRVAMRRKDLGIWHDITWSEYLSKVRHVALGLHALGVEREAHVAIIGENQPEWLYSALGVMSLGAIFVGIYTTNPAQECQYVVGHSGSVVYICEDEEQLDKALLFRGNTPKLRKLIVWDMEGLRHFKDPMFMSFADLLDMGKRLEQQDPELFNRLVASGKREDIAGIVYTSGTTGPPKGAMLSHEGYIWNGTQTAAVGEFTHKDETISFLPLCHVYEQVFALMVHLVVGHVVNFTESTDTLMRDLKEVSPTVFHAVPGIVLKMEDATWLKRMAYNVALKVGATYSTRRVSGNRPSLWMKLDYNLAYFAVFWKLKERLGLNKVRLANSAAAPIAPNILEYFQGIGLPIREGFGMTEATGTTHISDVSSFKLGTVGKALPGSEVKIAEDGEILIRSTGIFKGYYRDDKATRETLINGWLHTGDIGEVDSEGYLKITGRKKDLMITAGGKNIAPQFIENLLKSSPYINDAVILADGRKYVTAIIVIDEENAMNYAQQKNVQYTTFESLTKSEAIISLIDSEVNKINKQLARVENIKKFKILDKKLYTEDGEVTPTMKVKRKFINKHYANLIESMYQ
jgi:long-chain acyl-CoA synthetase